MLLVHKTLISSHSIKSAFEIIAQDWNRLREKPWPVLIEFLKKIDDFKFDSKDYLLDLGCGNGRHSLFFSNKVAHVIGVDFSCNLLRIANKKRKTLNIDNISYLMADISSLPFKAEMFNKIIFLATLHHIPNRMNRLSSLNEIKRMLKSSGSCLITVWRRWQKRFFWHFFKQLFHYLLKLKSFGEFGDIFIPWTRQDGEIVQRFYHLFTHREIRKLIKKAGFQMVLSEIIGGAMQRENIFAIVTKGG